MQLGRSIGANMRFNSEQDRLAVRDAFMITGAALVQIVRMHEGEDVADWGWKMEATLQDLTNGLLRLPVHELDENEMTGDPV